MRAPHWHPSFELTSIRALTDNGISHTLAHEKEVELSNYIRDFYFSTANLPEGDYESIEINLGDNFHNVAVHNKVMPLTVDRTPPAIALTVNGDNFVDGQEVIGLESLLLTITDENYPRIESIEMKGGPANDLVMLNWLVESDNRQQYVATLEYPRIFSSLEPGEEYSLTITAVDDFGNDHITTYTLAYQPANLVRVESISVFPVDRLLSDRGDNPLNVIVSNELRTDEGELASGEQSIMFTLRSDANYPVHIINETTKVSPGETVEVVYNITNNQGKLFVPIFPAVKGVQGESEFMLSIPLLEAN
ncbi:Ig-like domain-containing protein [Photobacterium sp. ZSDE20]|uniref:Ig-like domain-containing protein n=1 Tax=Photobacterium pectinilyticum TaxID=2906793 RepID=A0ABT1N8I0_9GAMM|nr:Ig-like domain-containing protein [Photobacterium sp. ZSDE20]MCQ1061036.1 Ig-like domain-containing protein [Photobacterium sp. ZSDE20]MDD1829128.1 Ig-like domain-containing protein [Photobacterium sp. ZSDE20]